MSESLSPEHGGPYLKSRRKQLGLTLTKAASSVEPPLNATYLAQLEKGKIKSPGVRMVNRLGSAYSLTASEVLSAFGVIVETSEVVRGPSEEILHPSVTEQEADIERLLQVEEAAAVVVTKVWEAIVAGRLSERGPVADSVLTLRDRLNPMWPNNSDWLPEVRG